MLFSGHDVVGLNTLGVVSLERSVFLYGHTNNLVHCNRPFCEPYSVSVSCKPHDCCVSSREIYNSRKLWSCQFLCKGQKVDRHWNDL